MSPHGGLCGRPIALQQATDALAKIGRSTPLPDVAGPGYAHVLDFGRTIDPLGRYARCRSCRRSFAIRG
jgi:hypothetical protein